MKEKEKQFVNLYDVTKSELNSFVTNIEFLLISVVQGAALATLATSASGVFGNFHIEYFLYAFSAFLFILMFWSQAIIHTLSFIDWPIDMSHNFLYFLLAFVEVMAFTELENPLKFFSFVTLFSIISAFLYFVDLKLIRRHKNKYETTKEAKALYKHIVKRQEYELKVLVPTAMIYNIVSVILIYFYPSMFLDAHYHVLLISLQVAFSLVILYEFIKEFKQRSRLITECIKEE